MCIYSQTCEAALSLSVSLASSSYSDALPVHDCMLFIFLLFPLACLFLTLFFLSIFLFLSPSLQQNNKSQDNWWRRIREEQELLPGDRRTPARRDQWEERWGVWPEPAEEITHSTHTHTDHQSTLNLICSGSSSGSTTGQTTPSTALRPGPRVCLLVCMCVCVSCMHYSNPPPVVLFLQEDDISQGSQSRGIR